MANAIFCGTFDPMTLGHLDILKKASNYFDKIFVAIPSETSKSSTTPLSVRLKIANATTKDCPKAQVISFSGLLTDFCTTMNTFNLIRGLRSSVDFIFERDLLANYKQLCPLIECTYFISSPQFSHISSSFVREVASYNGNISGYVASDSVDIVLDQYRRL